MNITKVKKIAVLAIVATAGASFAQTNFDLAPPNEAVLSQAEGLFRVPPSPAIIEQLFPTITIDPYQEGFERRSEFGIGLNWIQDDNGYRDNDNLIDNNQFALTPYYNHQSKLDGQHPYQFNAAATWVTNDEVSEDDLLKYAISGGISLFPASSFRTGIEAGASHSALARGQAGARILVDEANEPEDEFNNLHGKLQFTFGRDTDKLTGSVYAKVSDTDFINNNRDVADNTRTGLGAGVFYAYSPLSVIDAQIEYGMYDFPVGALDGDSFGWKIGWASEPSDNVAVNFNIGSTNRQFDELDFEETGNILEYAGSLVYRYTEDSNISFYLANTIDDADVATEFISNLNDQDGYFEASLIGLSVSSRLSDRFRIGGAFNRQTAEYRLGRDDSTNDYGMYLGYILTDYLTIGGMIGKTERDSNEEDAIYDDTYFGLYLRSNFVQ